MRVSALCMVFLAFGLQLLQAKAGYGQTTENTFVDIQVQHMPLRSVFSLLEDQTEFMFVFPVELVNKYQSVSINAGTKSVKEILNDILPGVQLAYRESGKNVIIFERDQTVEKGNFVSSSDSFVPVKGRVTDGEGAPMPGVNVLVKGTTYGTSTDADGNFRLDIPDNAEIFVFSFIGYKTIETKIDGRTQYDVVMQVDVTTLETIQVTYYETTSKTKTGNIAKVSAKDIENQPVTSPLLSLQGRMPGVDISPNSGAPGSAIKIQIRGLNSLRKGGSGGVDGNLPLYVIDGIPVMSAPVTTNSQSLLRNGFDPLSTIDPNNIESIQVLKDADATAIYGSRGANGVVLITTKTPSKGEQLHVDFGFYKGVGDVANRVEMLSTQQYLDMRKEAIKNDGGEAQANYDDPFLGPIIYPDLLMWDSTRYTDWQDMLVGGTSHVTDANINLSTGSATTTFSIGGSYHKETLLYPGDFGYKRYAANLNINHLSQDKKLAITFSGNFGVNSHDIFDSNQLYNYGLSLVPNAPPLYDQNGALNWAPSESGLSTWSNPLSWIRIAHESSAYNFLANSTGSYRLTRDITIKLNSGFSKYDQQEAISTPISSLNPNTSTKLGRRQQTINDRISWLIEPQINFDRNYNERHKVTGLIGMSFQQASNASQSYLGTGYSSDALLGTLAGARTITSQTADTQYRYVAGYARFSYSFGDKYLFNLTGRRDGSSRFGPGKRYGNFGAVGVGWIFSEESFMSTLSPWVSFGKIRFSYGLTGNDQIGDSQYIKTYRGATTTYNGQVALVPTALFNPDYAWEVTRKFEGALEIGLLRDRISMELAWYQNRSSNQLIQYQLPGTSGFPSVLSNFDATVENRGIEISVTSRNVVTNQFKWTTSANFTKASNELKSFPGIETSSYANTFKVGEPINVQRGYHWTGVDPATGIHMFRDLTDDGQITTADQDFIQPFITNYFGGIMNTFNFRRFELSFLVQFSDRIARTGYSLAPGIRENQPVNVLSRWQKEGDITNVQRFTTTGDAQIAYGQWTQSDGSIENVNFWRLKTATVSYTFSSQRLSDFGLRSLRLYVQGQNLLTKSSFDGWDPETLYGIPPLRIISGGIELKL